MRQKDKVLLIGIAVIAAIISLIISNVIFGTPSKHASTSPVVDSINTSFPDIKNDSNYNGFINAKALDPAQPVQIGNSQNSNPFR